MRTPLSKPNVQRGTQAGSAIVAALVIVLVLSGVTLSAMLFSMSHKQEVVATTNRARAFNAAEAGLQESLSLLLAKKIKHEAIPTELGSSAAPIQMKDGAYWCEIADNGDDTFTLTSSGDASLARVRLQQIVRYQATSVWDSAIFAGNSDGDPTYTLEFSGTGGQADKVVGNVYSGQDIVRTGDAQIDGEIHSAGSVIGVADMSKVKQGIVQAPPDIAGMNYEVNHDFDVAKMFALGATSAASALGGAAEQLPQASPAHIFRKNPSDRADQTSQTAKDDFFLEDPYQGVSDYTSPTGPGHTLKLSGGAGGVGPDGTNKLYYIDGNLWVHNRKLMSMRFTQDGGADVKLTFVVKGNVYFSDDVALMNSSKDGIAFIAINDDDEKDSGNIYFGDPVFGTLSQMSAFMYAENDFIDNNLDAAGSAVVKLSGNMTAGNHVDIERDFVLADGTINHSRLDVEFDDRISKGTLVLPGLPTTAAGSSAIQVLMWREVAKD